MDEARSRSGGLPLPDGAPGWTDRAAAPYDLRLFGAFRLTAADGSAVMPAGRKARAVLAYLGVVAAQSVSRERLAGLLWSDRADEQARASLRQCFYELRAVTGGSSPLLAIDRSVVFFQAASVRSDLDRLRALASGDDADALADEIGERPQDLLEDLDGLDAAFDEWLAAERVHWRDERRRVALEVAGRALAAGRASGALRLASCLLSGDPIDEAAARLAMTAQHAMGDRDSVRKTYARLSTALKKDLGVSPSEETQALEHRLAATQVAAAVGAGAPGAPAAVAPALVNASVPTPSVPVASPGDGGQADAPLPAPGTGARPRARPRRITAGRKTAAVVSALLVLVIASAALAWRGFQPDPERRVLMIQPLVAPADDPVAAALGKGLANDVARMIVGNDQRLSVVDPDDLSALARHRAQFLVAGTTRNADGRLYVDIKLLANNNAGILWSRSFARQATEIVALREQIASKLADVVICGLGGRNPSMDELGVETLRLYLSACEHKHDDWSESVKLLTQVVQRKPDFSHAWAMLAAGTTAAAYMRPNEAQALYREAEAHAAHALALDPHDGEAYYARAETLRGLDRWAQRMAVLEAGHGADPGNAPTDAAMAASLASVGRWKEAIAFAQQGEDADPFSPGQAAQLGSLLGFGPNPGDADEIMARARHRFPAIGYVTYTELAVAGLAGDPKHALKLIADTSRPIGLSASGVELWNVLLAARIDDTPQQLEVATRRLLASTDPSPPTDFAVVEMLAVLGRIDDAYRVAERVGPDARGEIDTTRLFRSDMAPFRNDRRFMPFAAHLGLVAIWTHSGRWPDFCNDPALPYDCQAAARLAPASAGVPRKPPI